MQKSKTFFSVLLAACLLLCCPLLGELAPAFAEWLDEVAPAAHALYPDDATTTDATPTDATPTEVFTGDPFDYIDSSEGTPYRIDVQSTGHFADYVKNYDGYASVSYNPKKVSDADQTMFRAYWEQWNANLPHPYPSLQAFMSEYDCENEEDWDWCYGTFPFMALFAKDGSIVMPYSEGETWYIVNDGVICRNYNGQYASVGGWKKYSHANGYFNLQGERLFENEYQFGQVFSEGVAFVRRAEIQNLVYTQWGESYDMFLGAYIIDTNGNTVLDLSDNFAVSLNSPKSDGAIAGQPEYFDSTCVLSSEGLFSFGLPVLIKDNVQNAVERNRSVKSWRAYGPTLYGYFDINGDIVIPQRFADCKPFYEGLAAVQDADIEIIEKPAETEQPETQNDPGTAIATKPIEDQYPKITVDPKKWGFIDNEGNTVIPFIYDYAERFYGDYAVVSKDGKYGVINRNNEIVVPFTYDHMYTHIADGLFVCEDEEGMKIKTLDEKTIFTLRKDAYSSYSDYVDGVLYYTCGHKLYAVKIEKEIALGDVDGNGKVEPADARLALRASVKLENYAVGSAQFLAADVDGNGKIESSDARTILRVSVKLESFA